jgi:hypothetical protein
MSHSLTLDDLYKMVSHIYSEQNLHRPARETFAHFVETCGMLALNERGKKIEEATVESALCKALGWFFPLMSKFKVASVEELVFRKFPYVCPYCRKCPHVDEGCKTVVGTKNTLNPKAVRDFYKKNAKRRPRGLNAWQQMFQDIYPRKVDDQAGKNSVGLLEELGELAEAVRVFDRHPKYFVGEAADVFSYLMGWANGYSLRTLVVENRVFSFEDEFIARYPGLCVQCGYLICTCPLIPEATVGRLAKELDILSKDEFDSLFSFDSTQFAREASQTASTVLERLGGYSGLVQSLPFDRGETNRTLVQLCLRLAKSVETENPSVAERLRSAAMQVVMFVTRAGSKRHSIDITAVIGSIQDALPEVSPKFDEMLTAPDPPFLGQLGRLLKKRKLHILLAFANPKGSTALRLGEEERAIREAINLSAARDLITLDTLNAATVDDFRRKILFSEASSSEYDIVHFSGHGEPGALLFETSDGSFAESPLEALAAFIKTHQSIKCVVMNACYSMADLICVAPYTVGMEDSIDDKAAVEFARAFYDAIGAGKDFESSVEEGKNNVGMKALAKDFSVKFLKADPVAR